MVKAPIVLTPTAHPLSNATLSTDVAVEADVDVSAAGPRNNNLLIADNTSGGVANNAADTAIATAAADSADATATATSSTNNDNSNKVHNDSHSVTTTTTGTRVEEEEHCTNGLSASTSDSASGATIKLNGNDSGIVNASSPTNEQSTQTDDDDNSSICSSTNSTRYNAIDQGEGEEEEQEAYGEDTGGVDAKMAYFEPTNTRDGGHARDKALEQIDERDEPAAGEDDDDEDQNTYCVGHFYGQDEDDLVPEKPPDDEAARQPNADDADGGGRDAQRPPGTEKGGQRINGGLESVPEANELGETDAGDSKSNELLQALQATAAATASTHMPVAPKSYTLPVPIPQIIGITGMIPQQQSLAPTPPHHHHHHPHHHQPSGGGQLQSLQLATLGTHSGGAVNQQISPTAAAVTQPGASTPIHHHHHCVHHPHVHLHSPGHQSSGTGAAGTSAATGGGGHPHTHIFPLQVISLTQSPGAAAAAAGAPTPWPLVEAPIYVDANGEYRTYCPAHPQGPPPREHRVLLQLDAGVSLPLQIAGKRKVFRGELRTV